MLVVHWFVARAKRTRCGIVEYGEARSSTVVLTLLVVWPASMFSVSLTVCVAGNQAGNRVRAKMLSYNDIGFNLLRVPIQRKLRRLGPPTHTKNSFGHFDYDLLTSRQPF